MKRKIFEKGTIKVVWIGNDPKIIHSKMFDNITTAKQFLRGKEDYLMFKLVRHKHLKEFEWQILPYGQYQLYKQALQLYKKHKNKIISLVKRLL